MSKYLFALRSCAPKCVKKTPGNLWRRPENRKRTNFRTPKISTFHSLGCPILIGTSRKRFIEHIVTKFDTPDRTGGTIASVLCGLLQGVQLFRVHNVKEINQGILVFNKILNTN